VTDVSKIFWILFLFVQELIFKFFETDICLILINIAVELNYLMLSKSYRSLQSDIYCIVLYHEVGFKNYTRPPELIIFTL